MAVTSESTRTMGTMELLTKARLAESAGRVDDMVRLMKRWAEMSSDSGTGTSDDSPDLTALDKDVLSEQCNLFSIAYKAKVGLSLFGITEYNRRFLIAVITCFV